MQQLLSPAHPVSLNQRLKTFAHALAFVAGFSLIFVIGWGGTRAIASKVKSLLSSFEEDDNAGKAT